MKNSRTFILVILFFHLLINTSFFAQQTKIDSLKAELKNSLHDTSRCNILAVLAETASDEEWPKFNMELKNLAEKNTHLSPASSQLHRFYLKHLAASLSNIGFIYKNQGDIPNALEYSSKSLKIQEEIDDKQGIAVSLNNIGFIYQYQGDFIKAHECYQKSLKLEEEIKDKPGIAQSLGNIGLLYQMQGNIPQALDCYLNSLELRKESGDKRGTANSLLNIGNIYYSSANYPKALEFYNKSLKMYSDIEDSQGTAYTLRSIGGLYFQIKDNSKALDYALRSMKVCRELLYPENILGASKLLNEIYKAKGNYKLALENYELYIKMRDSINNESTRKASIRSQLKYEYEKQAATDSVAHAKESEITKIQLQKQNTEIEAKKNQQYALFGGLALVLVFAAFMYNRVKITKKQKSVIESQKHLVEEKQKEILDSIHYAKRIQKSLLPTEKYIERKLKS